MPIIQEIANRIAAFFLDRWKAKRQRKRVAKLIAKDPSLAPYFMDPE